MSPDEEMIFSLVGKAFDVRRDGTIWRTAQRGRTGRWRITAPARADKRRTDGYCRVRIQIDGHQFSMLVHRLVWLVFRGHIAAGLEPNHKNGVRDDNKISNLELLTKGQNLAHSYRELNRPRTSGERNGRSVLTAEQVRTIRTRIARGESQRSIARAFGVTHRVIGKISRGEAWADNYQKGAR